ncbi:DNA-binding protein [Devosia sp. Root413D1]|uniref:DNA-binding protein n=1 Tax=Devosia sp. Root413D1 TaxID=1736531 RepID=UPI002A4E184D|nr:DNA-binding protein [Devosia sp. Root413D1]
MASLLPETIDQVGEHSEDGATLAVNDILDLAWGAREIARLIGKTPRATFHMLEGGQIPARKIGGQWVVSRRKLQDHFEQDAK